MTQHLAAHGALFTSALVKDILLPFIAVNLASIFEL
jgi:hypothetical protein